MPKELSLFDKLWFYNIDQKSKASGIKQFEFMSNSKTEFLMPNTLIEVSVEFFLMMG